MPKINNYAFIDGANLHFTYENIDWEIDYQKLRNHLKNKLGVTVAHYFIGKSPIYEDIYEKLASYDFNIRLKEPSIYNTEEEKCPHCNEIITSKMTEHKSDCDSFMTMQVMSDFHLYDRAVIITSDGDYDELVKMLLRQDKLRMVFAPCRKGCSKLLKRAAGDKIAFMDDFKSELEKI